MPPAYDPKFKNAGQKPGEIEIWRINKFDLEVVPKEQHGNFYSGDCYIVLKTKTKDSWDVHFWLGKNSTQDEQGTAAIKTVELDDSKGGIPVQYREIQDHESALFLSYFKHGIKYLQGGNATGFSHVVSSYENFKPRLFHVKGKRNVRCTEVSCVKESLNLGDVFILDLGLELLVWIPPEAGNLEKVKGVELAKSIRDQERAGRPKVIVLDDDWNTNSKFWSHFGGVSSVAWIKAPCAAGKDEAYWREKSANISLWQVSDASGKMQITKVRDGLMKSSELKTGDVFILDTGADVFVWIGKQSNPAERQKAQKYGQEYVAKQMRPKWTQIVKVFEGNEPQGFSQFFEDWQSQGKTSAFKPKLFNVSNETGKLVIEEVEDYYQEDLDLDDVMILDALNIIYVWIGNGANIHEKEAAEQTAQKYLKTDSIARHKKAEIEILHQGKETPGFKKLFSNGWDDKLWAKKENNYKNLRQILF